MALPQITRTSLGATALRGPFSEYLNADESAVLIALVRRVQPRVMVEIGIASGLTARRLLEHVPTLEAYYGVDVPDDFVTTLRCQQSEVQRVPGRWAYHDPRFHLVVRPQGSLEILSMLSDELGQVDAVFIDGDHSYNAVMHDSDTAAKLIRPGGVVIWHDYLNPGVQVTAALEALLAAGWPMQHVAGTWLAFAQF